MMPSIPRRRFSLGLWALGLMAAAGLALASGPARADRAGRVTPVVRVVRAVGPAVVNISTVGIERSRPFSTGDRLLDRLFEEFLQPMEQKRTSLGSGVIIDGQKGLIVTNSHVVTHASRITAHLADGRKFPAQLLGVDRQSDMALLRIKSQKPLPQVRLGDSGDLMIGESVIAIGNPFGLAHTVTVGVISALNRRVRTGNDEWLTDLIQTDASINPGNSGGPLLNADGEVVGINTAIHAGAQGIGFAIPVNRVKRVASDLVRHGEVIPSWLGLSLQDLNPRLAEHFGLKEPAGALVLEVMQDSPAQKAGIKRGNLILEVDGQRLIGRAHYRDWLVGVAAGQRIKLTIKGNRGVAQKTLTAEKFPLKRAMEIAWLRLGFSVADLDAKTARRHRVPMGSAVMITKLRQGSQAQAMGLEPGDLVRKVGDASTKDVRSFSRQMAKSRLLERITILVQRGRASQFVTLGG